MPPETLTDIRDRRGHSNFNARVTLLGQLTLEELVEFGVEPAIYPTSALSPRSSYTRADVPATNFLRFELSNVISLDHGRRGRGTHMAPPCATAAMIADGRRMMSLGCGSDDRDRRMADGSRQSPVPCVVVARSRSEVEVL